MLNDQSIKFERQHKISVQRLHKPKYHRKHTSFCHGIETEPVLNFE